MGLIFFKRWIFFGWGGKWTRFHFEAPGGLKLRISQFSVSNAGMTPHLAEDRISTAFGYYYTVYINYRNRRVSVHYRLLATEDPQVK